jgi:surfactin synthase thioesterase subunit
MSDATKTAKSRTRTRAKVKAYRARLRAQGLRPIQIWVPDTRAPGFAEEARRQCHLANESAHAKDDQDFVNSISWLNTDEAR